MQHTIGTKGGDSAFHGCIDCSILEGATAATAPHAALQVVSAIEMPSGTREEFVCKTCGERMLRFKAQQKSPPLSDRWRTA